MSLPQPIRAGEGAVARCWGAFIDPAHRERAVLAAIVAYSLVWAMFGTIAKSGQGLHYDMAEQIAWSRDLAFGYLKHPPLAAALVRIWFTFLPIEPGAYYVLAMAMPALALWTVWRLSADYLDEHKRVVALALLMLVPFFNFHALKFNVNTILIPLWAATTFWFLRSYKTHSLRYAALTGLGAAACMLGKYWSIWLLAGLLIAALIDRRRVGYFRSAAPWITLLVGVVVLVPHLDWLFHHNFAPLRYAIGVHGNKPAAGVAWHVLTYIGGLMAYAALPVIIVLLAAQPSRRTIADMIWPRDADRRLMATVFWVPLLLPIAGAVASRTETAALWSIPSWSLLPILLLSPPAVTLGATVRHGLLWATAVVPLIMVALAPAVAIGTYDSVAHPSVDQERQLVAEVEGAWNWRTPLPLRYVSGNEGLAYSVVTYAKDEPIALQLRPDMDTAQFARDGIVLICSTWSAKCVRICSKIAARNAASDRIDFEVTMPFFGKPALAQNYTIFIIPLPAINE